MSEEKWNKSGYWRIKAEVNCKEEKVKRYEQSISQFWQKQLFHVNQKQVYKELNREKQGDRIIPNSEVCVRLWSDF